MSRCSASSSPTRTRILDAAETLIADRGFRRFSLREVTREAGVNLAAVNYHFGSREGLVSEVLARVIVPINEQRLRLLDLAEARHAGSPVPLEEILEALHRPVVDRMMEVPHGKPVYLCLAGRCLAESADQVPASLVGHFHEVITRFMDVTRAALPEVSETSLFWRMHLAIGTMIYALTHEDRLPLFSGGKVRPTDPGDTLQRLIEFTAAGLRAAETPPKETATAKKSGGRAKGRAGATALGLAALALVFSGCRSLSPADATHHASVKAPPHWIAGPSWTPTHHPDRDWITTFGSRNLSEFVGRVLAENKDLKAAQARIGVAEANARILGADLLPAIDGRFSAQRDLQNFIGLPLPGAAPGSVLSTRSNRFGLSLNLSWEIDLWGRIRAAKSGAIADFEASTFDRATAELSLAGQAAKTWFAVAESHEQVELAKRAITTFGNTERAIRERFERGIAGAEGQNAASQLLLASADTAKAREQLAAREEFAGRAARQLEVLAGLYPSGRAAGNARLPEMPGRVPTGIPADLLDRRPDLAAAERRIAAADERLLEAKRSLLPAIRLTGSFGSASDDIGNLLSGDFSIWSVAGNLAQPIFQGGRLRANVSRRQAELELAAAEFEGAALKSFAEVENALAAESLLARRADALAEASQLSLAAYRRSLEEWGNGTGDLLTVLASQQRYYSSQSQWLEVRRLRLENRVDLHLALGGSFHPVAPPPDKSTNP